LITKALLKMIEYFGGDIRRINHALKVYGFAQAIREGEKIENKDTIDVIDLTAILHDIGILEAERKHNSNSGKFQELEGPAIAKHIMQEIGVDSDVVDRVCYIIGNHHSYQKIDDVDFQILVEADFIVNIFEDGLSESQKNSILNKYFKTKTGISFLKN